MRVAFFTWSVALAGCTGAASGTPATSEVTELASQLEAVRAQRILFSHHSVGRDLIAGLARASTELTGKPFPVVSLEQASRNAAEPSFVSISGGANQDPQSKLTFFARTLRAVSYEPELAFMKFCYVDFNPHTDVDGLFAAYQSTLDALKRERPRTRFAHMTVPLMARPVRIKDRIYRLIGREVWEDAANVKRHQFSQKLLEVYADDPIFDLARVESTLPDGSRTTFEHDGRTYYALAPAYTDDGGHLNTVGQNRAAFAWIRFLSSALGRRSHN